MQEGGISMSRQPLLALGLLGSFALVGCARASATGPAPATAAREPATPTVGSESRDLCLADPGGAAPADRQLRALQAGARKLGHRTDPWILVGRQWVRKARLASDPGFYVNADACATEALQIEAGFVPALELQALVLMNDHEFEKARTLAEQILAGDPESVTALGTLSDALLELGRYEEAARAAQRQMDARPGIAAYSRGSYLRWLHGDTRQAKTFIREALAGRDARDPEAAAWTFVEAGTIYWHEADYGGADAVYAAALQWVPDYAAALVGRARIALAKSKPAEAVAFLEKAYRTRPLPETAWLLGDAYEALGDAARAVKAYAEVERQGRRGDRLTLAYFYAAKNRNIDEALKLIDEERATRGGIYVDDIYAWVLHRAGRTAEARKASDRALRLGTRDARLLYHAGAIRIASGDEAAGRKLVQQAIELNRGFDRTGSTEAQLLLESSSQDHVASN
jgi:tetratricopeptide (TPR) repeat protein